MNFSLYFMNFSYRGDANFDKADSQIVSIDGSINFLDINDQPKGGNQKDTRFLANGKFVKTNFIKVNKEDLLKFRDIRNNGDNITQLGFRIPNNELKGNYFRYNNSNYSPGFNNNNQTPTFINQDSGDAVGERYFLIGQMNNNCIEYLFRYI
jgi:hypothetical protein